jgi:hypothetical protein
VAGRWFCTLVRGKIVFSRTIFFTPTVERTGQAVRGGVRIAGGYGALRSSTVYWLGYGERARVGPIPSTPASSSLPFSYSLQTLAAAMDLHLRPGFGLWPVARDADELRTPDGGAC